MAKLGCRATNLPLPWQKMAVLGYPIRKFPNWRWWTCDAPKLHVNICKYNIPFFRCPLLCFYLVAGCSGYFRHMISTAARYLSHLFLPKKMRLTLRILQDQPYHVSTWQNDPANWSKLPKSCRMFRRPHMATPPATPAKVNASVSDSLWYQSGKSLKISSSYVKFRIEKRGGLRSLSIERVDVL